ncbi:MAG TPA: GNAT family N-acetyltransferase [Thermohalobaculum sp.]|nr:GNAT family N-acetyltransferase [Thermohalobaculum sp.]
MAAALPVLRTRRLRLRPRTMADLDASVAMDREPGTLDWVDWPFADGGWDDPAAHRAFVEGRIRGPYPPGLGYWVVARHERPEEFLGWVLLIPEDAEGPEVEIGWRLTGPARGRGHAGEAAAALVEHGFATLHLPRIVAEVYRANADSNAVARRLGFRALPGPDRPKGATLIWTLERAEWLDQRRDVVAGGAESPPAAVSSVSTRRRAAGTPSQT